MDYLSASGVQRICTVGSDCMLSWLSAPLSLRSRLTARHESIKPHRKCLEATHYGSASVNQHVPYVRSSSTVRQPSVPSLLGRKGVQAGLLNSSPASRASAIINRASATPPLAHDRVFLRQPIVNEHLTLRDLWWSSWISLWSLPSWTQHLQEQKALAILGLAS